MSSNNDYTSNDVAPSNSNNEMTLRLLQLRTLQQAKRNFTSSLPSQAISTTVCQEQHAGPTVPSQGMGSSIPLLLQRRRRYREPHAGLPRAQLVKLMEEALSISTNITFDSPPQSSTTFPKETN